MQSDFFSTLPHFLRWQHFVIYIRSKWHIYIDTILPSYSDLTSFTWTHLGVCGALHSCITHVGSYTHHQLGYWSPLLQELCCPFTTRPTSLPYSSPILKLWQPLMCPPFLKFCHFKTVNKKNLTVYNL